MRHGDEERDGEFAQEGNHLPREVGFSEPRADEDWVDDVGECRRECWAREGIQFDDEEGCYGEVAPISALFEVAEGREEDETCRAADVVDAHLLQTRKDEVTDRLGVLPGENVGSESIVREAFGWIDEGIAGDFEADVDLFEGRLVGLRGLIGVVLDCESSESGLDATLFDIVRDAEEGVEVAFLEELIIGFVDGVEEVEHYDGDLDVAPVLDEEWRPRRWFRVASADEDCI